MPQMQHLQLSFLIASGCSRDLATVVLVYELLGSVNFLMQESQLLFAQSTSCTDLRCCTRCVAAAILLCIQA